MSTPGIKDQEVSSKYLKGNEEKDSAVVNSSSSVAVLAQAPADVEAPRENITLPIKVVVSKKIETIIASLEKLANATENNDEEKCYPVIIGSHAAAFWLPSFRTCSDWDLVATPQQAIDIIKNICLVYKDYLIDLVLSYQNLDSSIIRHKPISPKIQEMIDSLPARLYKVEGEIECFLKFEIEIAVTEKEKSTKLKEDNTKPNNTVYASSAAQLLSICNSDNNNSMEYDEGYSYYNFLGASGDDFKCLVASLTVLEALKSSHINWPVYFDKHINDIHALRMALAPSTSSTSSAVNIGVFAKTTKPLTVPERTQDIKDFLLYRTLETEAYRGTPGAHINLNVSNEDFLDRDDDLFVARHIPHDDIHNMVMYGNTPIYDQLKTDKSKAMISRKLFEQAPYDQQIKCIKEEAMVIALERFLLPKLSEYSDDAYRSALRRICTTLTKGWFRQFAIDNFIRLNKCDKDLMPICKDILTKHPLPPKVRDNHMDLVKGYVENLEDLHTLQKLNELVKGDGTLSTIVNEYLGNEHERQKKTGGETRRGPKRKYKSNEDERLENDSEEESEESYDSDGLNERDERDKNKDYRRLGTWAQRKVKGSHWVIESYIPGRLPLVVSFINESVFDDTNCHPSTHFFATLSVQEFSHGFNSKSLAAYGYSEDTNEVLLRCSHSFHKFKVNVNASVAGGSWGGRDIWSSSDFLSKPLKKEVEMIGLEGLTEDLLMIFILALVQPKLFSNGETPLVSYVNRLKSACVIPVTPNNHTWFDLWKLELKKT